VLRAARLSWKKVKKLLGKAKAAKRAEHITLLEGLFARVHRSEVTLIYVDESHFHQDLDEGYTWGPKGERAWRVSTTPEGNEPSSTARAVRTMAVAVIRCLPQRGPAPRGGPRDPRG